MAGAVNDKYPSFSDGAIGADRHWLEPLANNPYELWLLEDLSISQGRSFGCGCEDLVTWASTKKLAEGLISTSNDKPVISV